MAITHKFNQILQNFIVLRDAKRKIIKQYLIMKNMILYNENIIIYNKKYDIIKIISNLNFKL